MKNNVMLHVAERISVFAKKNLYLKLLSGYFIKTLLLAFVLECIKCFVVVVVVFMNFKDCRDN